MALIKTETLDLVEFVGIHKILQARYVVLEKEDGVVVSENYKRLSFNPSDDISILPAELQAQATENWTPEVIANYTQAVAS